MISNNVSLVVVVNGNNGDITAREYTSPVDHQTYIEGREESNFTLRIKNSNHYKVLVVPSVDGLSVLDGKPAGEKSPGYVLDAYQTLDVPGWTVDANTAAKFYFAGVKAGGEDTSYVAQSGNSPVNKGVIGLKVFKEAYSYVHSQTTYWQPPLGSYSKSIGTYNTTTVPLGTSVSLNSVTASSIASDAFNNIQTELNSLTGSLSATASRVSSLEASMSAATQTLGTGFGKATDFETQKVQFKRGDLLTTLIIFYDDRRGLKRMGIEVDRPKVARSAFPADDKGCVPPTGWTR